MLVVSRKQNQSVVFPTLGITVEILRVAGKAVRVGVSAPEKVRVLRGELVDSQTSAEAAETAKAGDDVASAKVMHDLRNRMNKAQLAMTLLETQLAAGRLADAEESLAMALRTFEEMEQSASTSAVAQPSETFEVSTRADGDAPKRPKRALLVEDDPNERMLLASYLRSVRL